MSDTLSHDLIVTDAAREKLLSMINNADTSSLSEGEKLRLRISVKTGGCSGLIYDFTIEPTLDENDLVRDYDGLEAALDMQSAGWLTGATFDYVESIEKMGFTINNPNATATCACGTSFN